MDYIQPQRSQRKTGAREFVLQRMLLNDDERLNSIVSGTSGHLRTPTAGRHGAGSSAA